MRGSLNYLALLLHIQAGMHTCNYTSPYFRPIRDSTEIPLAFYLSDSLSLQCFLLIGRLGFSSMSVRSYYLPWFTMFTFQLLYLVSCHTLQTLTLNTFIFMTHIICVQTYFFYSALSIICLIIYRVGQFSPLNPWLFCTISEVTEEWL